MSEEKPSATLYSIQIFSTHLLKANNPLILKAATFYFFIFFLSSNQTADSDNSEITEEITGNEEVGIWAKRMNLLEDSCRAVMETSAVSGEKRSSIKGLQRRGHHLHYVRPTCSLVYPYLFIRRTFIILYYVFFLISILFLIYFNIIIYIFIILKLYF